MPAMTVSKAGGVAHLASGDTKGQGPCTVVAGEVDFRTQAAAGASERMVVRFGPVWRPFCTEPARPGGTCRTSSARSRLLLTNG